MDTDHHKVCDLCSSFYLLLDLVELTGIEDMRRHFVVLRDAVGVFGIGKIGNANIIDRMQRNVCIVVFSAPKSRRDHIRRHGFPKPQSSAYSASAFIIGMIVC